MDSNKVENWHRPLMGMQYCLSQDLGKLGDWHGEVLTEVRPRLRSRTEVGRPWQSDADVDVMYPEIIVKWLGRSQVSYDELIDQTIWRLDKPELYESTWHVVDATGVGLPTIDMMRRRGLSPVGVWLTSGAEARDQSYGYSVPKTELINSLQLALSSGMIRFSQGLDQEVQGQLLHEFKTFREKKGSKLEAWREKDHDDMVLSLAMNVWWLMRVFGVTTIEKQQPDEYKSSLIYGM